MFLFWLIIFLLTLIAIMLVIMPLLKTEGIEKNSGWTSNALVVLLIIVGLPLLGLLGYLKIGSSKAVTEWMQANKNSESVKQEIAKYGSRQNIIIALRRKLEQLPNTESSAKGWYILGKLYFNEHDPQEAYQAFLHAVRLKPNEPEYMLQLVSTHFFMKQVLDKEDQQIIARLLLLSPNNINAFNLLALDAFQKHQYAIAINYWERLLQYFPPGSEDSNNLLLMIKQAQSHLIPGQSHKQIIVKIELASELEKKVSPNDSLFVYALSPDGPKIPLAVVRLQATHFPLSITLDNSNSMMPTRTLDSANRAYVTARISRSGKAIPAKGDLIGQSSPFKLLDSTQTIKVRITASQ